MASLALLPMEVLDMILVHLAAKSLARLCSTCRALNLATEPYLYREIHLRWQRGCHPHIGALLKTLITRPELGLCIKHISFVGHRPSTYRKAFRSDNKVTRDSIWDNQRHWMEDGFIRIADFLDKMGLSDDEVWLTEYAKGEVDVAVAIIIALCPNLEKLKLTYDFLWRTHFVREMLQQTTHHEKLPHRFEKLRAIDIWCGPNDMAGELTEDAIDDRCHLIPFLDLPGVSRIKCAQRSNQNNSYPVSNITSLHLQQIDSINRANVVRLFQGTPKLKDLVLHIIRTKTLTSILSTLAAVPKHVETLKVLLSYVAQQTCRYQFDLQGYRDMGLYYDIVLMGGGTAVFRRLKRLRSLQAPLILFFGWNDARPRLIKLLPPSLKDLVLTDDLGFRIASKNEAVSSSFVSYLDALGTEKHSLSRFTLINHPSPTDHLGLADFAGHAKHKEVQFKWLKLNRLSPGSYIQAGLPLPQGNADSESLRDTE